LLQYRSFHQDQSFVSKLRYWQLRKNMQVELGWDKKEKLVMRIAYAILHKTE
jgi:hypothetical protein